MPIDRDAKLTAKWLSENTSARGPYRFRYIIDFEDQLGSSWLLIVKPRSSIGRQVYLYAVNAGKAVAILPLRRVSTAGELIDLYNQLSATPWPGTEQ